KGIFCHGYLTVKGEKISKSMPATKVDPNLIAADLGVDPLRYFVLREYSFGGDGDFTYEALFQRYESDLGNDLGNLLNRTISMVRRYVGPELPPQPPEPHDLAAATLDDATASSRSGTTSSTRSAGARAAIGAPPSAAAPQPTRSRTRYATGT